MLGLKKIPSSLSLKAYGKARSISRVTGPYMYVRVGQGLKFFSTCVRRPSPSYNDVARGVPPTSSFYKTKH
jgi:hypothetical protein